MSAPVVAVGVDGGGTGTRLLALDKEEQLLGEMEGPSSLVDEDHPELAAGAVVEMVRTLALRCGWTLPVSSLWAGMAGAGRAAPRSRVEAALVSAGVARFVGVGTDVEAAFHDAFPDGFGAVLVSGTGSILLARDPGRPPLVIGGWGERLGDEGSGYRLGQAAVQALLRAHDGRGPGTLLRGLLPVLGLERAEELVGWSARADKRAVAALAPHVFLTAGAGDEVAAGLIEDSVSALGEHLRALALRLGERPDQPRPPVALVGGLIGADGPLHDRVRVLVQEAGFPHYRNPVRPERGAALLALRQLRA